jgi:hypothetical protein
LLCTLTTVKPPAAFEGSNVQALAINGDWYIRWSQLSSKNIITQSIDGGYNLIYTAPLKIQLNGVDFAQGGYYRINTAYVNWNALRTACISPPPLAICAVPPAFSLLSLFKTSKSVVPITMMTAAENIQYFFIFFTPIYVLIFKD